MPPAAEPRIRVLVADDDEVFAQALRLRLCADERVDVVGIAKDGMEVVELAAELAPDVILMDIAMPRLDGIEATRRLRSGGSRSQVLLVTGDLSIDSVDLAAVGAAGFVSKSQTMDELLAAFYEIAAIAVAFGKVGARASTASP